MPEISITRVNAIEAQEENLTFEVTLSEVTDEEVQISFRSIEGTAGPRDFMAGAFRTGLLRIAPGEATGLISFSMFNDPADEIDESIWLELYNPKNAVFAGGEASLRALGVVRDNDGTGSNLALFVSNPTLVEGNNTTKKAVFEVHLSQPHSSDLTFTYKTADGTAKAGSDYVAKSGTVTFLAGQTVASVEVDVKGDVAVEGSEFFSLVVTPTSVVKNDTAGSTGIATVLDNDTGRASGPTISITRVNAMEAQEENLTFEVTLSETTDEEVQFSFRSIEGTAGPRDFMAGAFRAGPLTIAPGEKTKLISFSMFNDGADEVDESIWLELSNPQNAVFAGGEASLRALGVVRDNDGTGSNLALFVSNPTLVEGTNVTKKAVFEVHLSQPHASDLTFTYRTADGTAKAGSDYVAKSGTVTFLAGQTVASVEVDVKGDVAVEGSEFFSLVVTPTSAIKNGAPAHAGRATLVNDDTIHQTIYGTTGNDRLYGNDGDDVLYGLAGNDLLDGGTGLDTIYGGNGNDTLVGSKGNDVLVGGLGADRLFGGEGGDRFLFISIRDTTVSASGLDTIFDFNADDKIDLRTIDANGKTAANDAFSFIGTKGFSKTVGELRYEKQASDTYLYGDVNGDARADFAIHLDDAITISRGYLLL